MDLYGILNSRKRAVIALAHSLVFLAIAVAGLHGAPKSGVLYPERAFTAPRIAILCVYLIVTSVLAVLARYSRCVKERAYFAFCTASAGVGVLRALFGDPVPYVGPIARVLLLGTAVAIGFSILNAHSQAEAVPEN